MAKETVIIFDGEDKFVSKRNKKYDAKKGISNFVGSTGEVSTETTSTTTTAVPIVLGVPMPIVDGSSDYCSRLQVYIESRGDGLAAPEQIMEAHQYFLTHCNPVNQTTSTSTTTTTTTNATTVEPTTTSTTTSTTTLPIVSGGFVYPAIPIGLGQRPVGAKSGYGGGSDEKSKSKNYWLLLLIGLGILYVFSKDNKN